MFTLINSPLEQFEINTLIGLSSFLLDISFLNITTYTLYILIVFGLFYSIFSSYGTNGKNGSLISNRWNLFIDALYFTILNMVINQISGSQKNKEGTKYFPFIFSLFIFILFANLVSMIPYNFAINAQLIFCISLSVSIWFGLNILGFYMHGFKYFGLFVPAGCSLPLVPLLVLIEGISNLARSISLGLRLGANILSGHLLMTILSGLIFDFMSSSIIFFFLGFIPLAIVLGILSLEFAIAGIQAYVFCILTCSYFKDAIYLH